MVLAKFAEVDYPAPGQFANQRFHDETDEISGLVASCSSEATATDFGFSVSVIGYGWVSFESKVATFEELQ